MGRYFYRTVDSNERTASTQLASYTAFTYSYDTNGRLSEIEQGSSRPTNFAYYSSGASKGMLNTITDALSEVTTFAYDNAGRVTSETLPDTRVIGFTYDSNGNLASVTPPGKGAHTLNHNGFDFLSKYITPTARMELEEETHSVLKSIGQKVAKFLGKFSAKAQDEALEILTTYETDYTYNNDRQLTTITRPDTTTINFNYDSGTGVLSTIVIPTGTNTYTYNYGKLLGNSLSIDSVNQAYSWQGYLLSNLSSSYNSSSTRYSSQSFTYNSNFLLASDIITSNGTTTGTTYTYGYDNDNLMTSAGSETITRGSTNGFVTQTAIGSNSKILFSYDATYGELSEIQGKYSSTVKYEEDITRDVLGRVSAKTEKYPGTSHTYAYTYDSAGRLITVTKDSLAYDSYGYDTNSNRNTQTLSGTTIVPTYDGVDRLATFGTKTYTFSGNGYLSSIYDSSTTKTTSYTYDALGNLKSVTLPSTTVINYTVDGENRRTSKATGSTINNYFVWGDKGQLLATLTSAGAISQRFIYGTRTNVPDYMVVGTTKYQFVTDHLGSVVQVINTSNGSVVEQIQYDEFGKILSDSSPGYTPFGFAGGLYDKDTGLVRFGARDYDASTGRWTNRDPILFKGGDTNLYGYVLADPINKVDPSGKGPLTCAGATLALGAYNAYQISSDYTKLANQYNQQVSSLEAQNQKCGGDNAEIQQKIVDLGNQFQKDALSLAGQYLTPNPLHDAIVGAICLIPDLP